MNDKVWEYRIVRSVKEDGTDADWHSIQEVYYDDDGNPNAQSIDLQVEGEDNKEMKIQLEDMMSAIDKPILNESDIIPSSVDNTKKINVTDNNMIFESSDNPKKEIDINQRLSNLEIENADLKNMLRAQGVEIV
jgi:hypothetical protein